MQMGKFEFMGFGYDGSHDDMFVAHAVKYSADQTIELCLREFENKFNGYYGRQHRVPTQDDIIDGFCAFRFGVSPEWPEGCYTFVDEGEPGAFPVHAIKFEDLRMPKGEQSC